MTNQEQRKLLTNFCDQVRDHLLSRSDHWPEDWDGHELRELVIEAFTAERTRLMREKYSRRRRRCHNEIIVNNLY